MLYVDTRIVRPCDDATAMGCRAAPDDDEAPGAEEEDDRDMAATASKATTESVSDLLEPRYNHDQDWPALPTCHCLR